MPALNITQYMELPDDDTIWIWRGILPRSGSISIFGDPKVGKSRLILGLSEAIADPTIEEYLGQQIEAHGPVLYIQLDTPRSLWKHGYLSVVKSDAARGGVYTIDREMKDLPKGFDMRHPEHIEWLRREVILVSPLVVIVDTVRRMHKGNENESDTMAVVHDNFIAACYPAGIVYITHKTKAQAGMVGHGTARGSSAFGGAVDALLNLTKSKLYIEARSDVEEELAVYQTDTGMWSLNSQESEIKEYIAKLPSGVGLSMHDKMIAERFTVSIRTARRWRTTLTKGDGQ